MEQKNALVAIAAVIKKHGFRIDNPAIIACEIAAVIKQAGFEIATPRVSAEVKAPPPLWALSPDQINALPNLQKQGLMLGDFFVSWGALGGHTKHFSEQIHEWREAFIKAFPIDAVPAQAVPESPTPGR